MGKSSLFKLYNASAGSGKTFNLVKEYLVLLLNSEDIFSLEKFYQSHLQIKLLKKKNAEF